MTARALSATRQRGRIGAGRAAADMLARIRHSDCTCRDWALVDGAYVLVSEPAPLGLRNGRCRQCGGSVR